MTDDVVTVSDSLIVKTIGSFPELTAVDSALKHTLALA